ncbi:MAG TPA: chromosome segregation protein SMC [Kofleriaceae bacterium]|nr:chromosome segregation protein SMC [Kofleriaceae bacterium]
MRIKRIEIIGFKSFCDRAVINIDQPITAVVGPNGCGKSNIVDAIRWCMGEQSAKHLRGKAMEDVIFAGSETRGPAPMAEVSLTFDDVGFSHETLAMAREGDEAAAEAAMRTVDAVQVGDGEGEMGEGQGETGEGEGEGQADGESGTGTGTGEEAETGGFDAAAMDQVVVYDENGQPIASAVDEVKALLEEQEPLDFTRYTEVTISRRLYRDGTSQYFINKVPCRLRDVTDFFLGTGVGTKAYAIIEQGRIGQIVSSRPQDRRLIIEEAAGITKFKSKKKAAERKLEQTKQNLLRVSDIVTELEKRMGTLRRQAQKAERYRAYKTELRDLDLWKSSHRFLELRADDARVRGRLTEAADELVGVRATFDTKDAAVVTERADLSIEERRLSGVQEVIYELENRVRLAESKIGWQTREADDLDGRATAAATEIETLDAERAAAAAQLAQQEAELAELVSLVGQGDDEVARCEALHGEAKQTLANAQSRLDEARNQLSRARTDVATATAQTESVARRREDGERRLSKVSEELDQAVERQKDAEREARKTGETLAQLKQTRLDLGAQTEGFAARRDVLAEQVHEGEAQVETLRTEAHRRRSRLVSLVEIQERYEGFARGTRVVMQQAGMIAHGARGDGNIRGLVADVVRAPEMLELAVEAALGDRLGGVLVDDHEVGVAAIGYLKSHSAGRSAFVPMGDPGAVMRAVGVEDADAESALERALDDSHMLAPDAETVEGAEAGVGEPGSAHEEPGAGPYDDRAGAASWATAAETAHGIVVEDHTAIHAAAAQIGGEGVLGRLVDLVGFADGYDVVGQSLFGDCIVVDTLDRAVELHKAGAPGTLVTLDGDIVDERGVVSGGSREAPGAGVLAQKREIRELEQIVDSLDRELTEATARLVTAKTEHKQLDRAIEGLRGQAHQGDLAIMGHEKDASRLRSELERLRERAGYLTGERNELEERLAAAQREQEALITRKADAEHRIDHFEREQLGMIEGVTGGRERVDEAAAALTEARVRVAQTAEKRASVEAATLRLANTERDLGARIVRLRESISTGSARAAELRADAAALQSELEIHREQRITHSAELETGRAAYDARYTALAQLEIEARELRSQADKLATEVNQLEVRAASIESQRQVVTDTVFEKYQLDVAEAVPEYHLRGVCGETEDARAQELRELIEKMSGDINLTAIEEYQEVAKRFDFLTGQKADLENAVGQLEHAIDKINKTSRRLFKETFASVNATFKEVFPRLFRGGNAHLSLATGKDSETGEKVELDVLEAGVEIFAQPPGKKNSTVDQLSGGEKALTAVALVFSIFLIKPSPFCILDEVDAPLDESNVDRYNEIVREMTDRSQFIVISHNKRTMESADNLYGVTMQEAGVSKLVSVNLSKLGDKKTAAA